jgi:SAM-dependent methyltransferase
MLNRRFVVIGCVVLVLGLAIRHFLNRTADVPLSQPPGERQGLNAPFITTPDVVLEKMVELAELRESDLVYDLGCGDGRIVITAALRSGCKGVGFDIDPERVSEARENARLHEVDERVQIIEQDIFTVDLSKADVVMMYLLPWMMNALVPQFQEMRPGCRIVTHVFWIDGVEPDEMVDLVMGENNETTSIYVYRTPLRFNPAMEKGKPPRP